MQVICAAGYSGCDYPKAFNWLGHRLPVRDIIKEWREPDAKNYLVTTANGSCFKLVFSETEYRWSIHEVSGLPNL
jgi:hypothetical protein